MGRAERQVDPEAGPLQRFAWELRQLRLRAGRPSYRELAARVHYSASMLSEAAAGLSLPSLPVTLSYVQGCGGDRQEWERRWQQLAAELSRPAAAPEEPPYLGLSTFQARDAERFFGRRAQVRELVGRLAEGPFLAVFGASGSGKSSLLRAGLVPALAGREACGGRPAGTLVLTPGTEPLQELAAALAARQGVPAAALHADLRAAAANGALAVRQAVAADPGIDLLVIVVDQFEEVFTLCRDDGTRRRFLDCLLAIAAGCPDRARVVLGVRADFYPHCARHPGLVAALRDRQVLIGPMDDADLRAVVTGPAERAGHRVEPALVDAVLTDVAHQPGALPLVSHALLETWHRRQGRLLTLAGYREAGGVAEAVARTAERVFGELEPARQEVVQDIFLRLTALGEGTEDTRRHVPYAELPSGPEAAGVLEELARARLVSCDEHTVTVAHEVLIRRWPRLRSWLTADREQLRAHRRLTEATAEWEQHGRDDAFLWRGSRLASWQERPADRLNEAERAFLAAGRRVQEHEQQARRRRARWAVSVLSAVVVVVTVLATLSAVQARRAGRERDLAFSNELAAAAREQLSLKPELSLLLARQALLVRHTPAAEAVLRQATAQSRVRSVLAAGQGQVFGVGFSPDGRLVATSGDNGTVHLWQRDARGPATGPPRVLAGHRGEVWSPTFSADSRLLAAGGIDGTVTVWDLGGQAAPRVLRGTDGPVWTVAFSPDGRRLAGAGDDGSVRIWEVGRGGAAVTVLRGTVRQLGIAYSPDGRSLAASDGDGVVRVWAATGAGRPRVLRGPASSVESLAFGPDSRALAGASTDGTLRVWRLDRTGEAVVLRGDDSGTAEAVAFSPDGRRVAGGGSDGTVRVFNVDGDTDPLVLPGHDGPVWSLAFSPDGAWLASGSGDGSARFWDPAGPGGSRVLAGHAGAIWGVALSPAGGPLVTAGQDGTVRLWPRGAAGPPTILRGHSGDVNAVAAGPGGTRVASAGMDHTVRVWDVATGRATVLRGHTGEVWELGFLPDGGHLASAGGDGTVRIWDISAGTATVLKGHDGSVRSVAVAPDGRHVASGGRDGTVRVWDLATGRAVTLRGHTGGLVFRVTFSPDGRQVASGGHDGTIRLWDVAGTGSPTVLRGHRGAVWSVSYSPDGRLLATSGDDGGLRIWRTTEPGAPVVLRGFGSPVEGVVFGPGADELATVHDDGTLRLSRCDVCGSLDRIRALAETGAVRGFTTEERQAYLRGDHRSP